MSVRYHVVHDTHYRYDSPVSLAQQLARLWPRACAWQRCTAQALQVSPEPTQRRDEWDVFGNPLTRLAFERQHEQLRVVARLHIEVLPRSAPQLSVSPAWEQVRDALSYTGKPLSSEHLQACRYRFESPYVRLKQRFVAFSASCFAPGRPLLAGSQALMEKIFSEFTFEAGATQVATPLEQVLERRRGVCQDFAHLMLACLRSRGLAARYVSGYLLTRPPPGQPRLVGADASHAWVSVFCPLQGWVDFDPTNNLLPALEHITLAWGRDFFDVSPLRGVILGGGTHDPQVQVTVMPLEDGQP
ncbi:transglutaminase family protein [Pseudomonas sp. V1]|uniref:transglutaminase family protein n=1 Tax=Pseudomonas arcuscaelestis TaxID=2710591 RepID=UPI00193F6805|nr:transglutaminase family protein [Pseudomonas arcuscaelestis]MBM3106432.1 transglutaminase family protein [Pseudomonas arcuscaelestis]